MGPDQTARYAVGESVAMVHEATAILIPGKPDDERSRLCWTALVERGVEGVLDVLFSQGLRSAPDFAMCQIDGFGRARALGRGHGRVELVTDAGDELLDEARLLSDHEYAGVIDALVTLGDGSLRPTIPLMGGLVAAGSVRLFTQSPDQALLLADSTDSSEDGREVPHEPVEPDREVAMAPAEPDADGRERHVAGPGWEAIEQGRGADDSEPVVVDAAVQEPVLGQSQAAEPDPAPEVAEPELAGPEVAEPEVAGPEPEVAGPEPEPELAGPEVAEPELAGPELEVEMVEAALPDSAVAEVGEPVEDEEAPSETGWADQAWRLSGHPERSEAGESGEPEFVVSGSDHDHSPGTPPDVAAPGPEGVGQVNERASEVQEPEGGPYEWIPLAKQYADRAPVPQEPETPSWASGWSQPPAVVASASSPRAPEPTSSWGGTPDMPDADPDIGHEASRDAPADEGTGPQPEQFVASAPSWADERAWGDALDPPFLAPAPVPAQSPPQAAEVFAPPEPPDFPPPPGLAGLRGPDPDGDMDMTIVRSDLTLSAAPVAVAVDSDGPLVIAKICANGHYTVAFQPACRVCGGSVPEQEPVEVNRPPLGELRLESGESISLDRDVVLGRSPRVPEGHTGEPPHLARITDPKNEVSSQHALVSVNYWLVNLTDLGSTNGTEVIDRAGERTRLTPHTPVIIEPGSTIILGEVSRVVFEAGP